MVIELVYSAIFWLNTFSPSVSVHGHLSLSTIITGCTIDFNKHCKIKFGSYVQTHEQTDNNMQSRTVGAISLRPTGNDQGGHFYLSLVTGRLLNRLHVTPLPMPDEVITRVHEMARLNPKGLFFCDRNNKPISSVEDDSDNESSYSPNNITITFSSYQDDLVQIPGVTFDSSPPNNSPLQIKGVTTKENTNYNPE